MDGFLEFARTASAWDFYRAAALLGAGLGFGFWRWFISFKRSRLIEDVATSRIRSAAQGHAELCGRQLPLSGEGALQAPLSGRSCTWWSYTVEKKVRRGKDTHWETIESKTSPHLFLCEDETGAAIVNPVGAEVVPEVSDRWYGHSARPDTGPKAGASSLFGKYRYTERLMRPGQPLYAIGHFVTRSGEMDREARDRKAVELLKEWKRDPAELARRFDADGDGMVDVHEWELAREEAARIVAERSEEGAQETVHLLIKPPDGDVFLLSSKSQEELVGHYRVRAVSWLVVWLLCGSALGVALTARLGA